MRQQSFGIRCWTVLIGALVLLTSATALAQTGETPGADSSVIIGPGDLLEVSVLGIEELSRRVQVLGDGSITLPPLGNFLVAGQTVQQLEATVAKMLADNQLVNDPQVSIFVAESVGGGVSVQGAVLKPGMYNLVGRNTLIEVVGQAGGLAHDAGGRILVMRGNPESDQETLEIDVERLMEEGDSTANISLRAGDIVVVPRGRKLRVYVTGAVEKPGAVEYSSTEGITVLQAITAAGGPTERANLKKVTINRRLSDGTEDRIQVNVKKIQNGKEPDIPLERNDTVVVGEWLL
jgi:polysaccharide export outer membrane protein